MIANAAAASKPEMTYFLVFCSLGLLNKSARAGQSIIIAINGIMIR
jgi:hypothetical protein